MPEAATNLVRQAGEAAVHAAEAAGHDFLNSLPIFAQAARSPDPKGYLRAWLADQSD